MPATWARSPAAFSTARRPRSPPPRHRRSQPKNSRHGMITAQRTNKAVGGHGAGGARGGRSPHRPSTPAPLPPKNNRRATAITAQRTNKAVGGVGGGAAPLPPMLK